VAGARRLLIALVVAALVATGFAAPATAATRCQCVTYVANVIGRIGVYAAKDAGPKLVAEGHKRYYPSLSGARPRSGDILVFQAYTLGAGQYGHIGFVEKYRVNSSGRLVLWMRSANWGRKELFRDHGCTNVNIVRLPSVGGLRWRTPGLAFYRR
jgi:hypothetical protein